MQCFTLILECIIVHFQLGDMRALSQCCTPASNNLANALYKQ